MGSFKNSCMVPRVFSRCGVVSFFTKDFWCKDFGFQSFIQGRQSSGEGLGYTSILLGIPTPL